MGAPFGTKLDSAHDFLSLVPASVTESCDWTQLLHDHADSGVGWELLLGKGKRRKLIV